MSGYECIDLYQAESMLLSEHALLLDMRDYRFYSMGHHPRALHLNDGNLRSLLKHTSKHIPVIIYCYHGHSSQDMAQLFYDFGFARVYSLDGGYEAWFQSTTSPKKALSAGLVRWLDDNNFSAINLDQRAWNNETALMTLSRMGNADYCRELIAAGASVNLVNKDGNNALWLACFADNLEICELLIGAGIDLDNQNDNGATALIYAASAGRPAVVKTLVKHGAKLDLVTLDDYSAMDVAADLESFKFLRSLFKKLSHGTQNAQAVM